jgi:hypothetical protein
MKLKATPLLEPNAPSFFVEDDGSDLQSGLHPRQFVDLLDRHKAVLFQAGSETQPLTTEDFGRFVVDLNLEYYPYIGGAAPRTIIPVEAGVDVVFTANERWELLMKIYQGRHLDLSLFLQISCFSFAQIPFSILPPPNK